MERRWVNRIKWRIVSQYRRWEDMNRIQRKGNNCYPFRQRHRQMHRCIWSPVTNREVNASRITVIERRKEWREWEVTTKREHDVNQMRQKEISFFRIPLSLSLPNPWFICWFHLHYIETRQCCSGFFLSSRSLRDAFGLPLLELTYCNIVILTKIDCFSIWYELRPCANIFMKHSKSYLQGKNLSSYKSPSL